MQPPIIVNISRLHRATSAIVRQAETAEQPVFVTQFACVVAVLLPRGMYDRLLRAAERASDPDGGSPKGGLGPPLATPGPPLTATGPPASPLESPLAVFGPLPRGTRFLTRQGLSIDAELAAFLMEGGEEVRPILRREEDDGWGEEDDGWGEEDGGSGGGGGWRLGCGGRRVAVASLGHGVSGTARRVSYACQGGKVRGQRWRKPVARRGRDQGAAMRVLIAHANENTRMKLTDVVTRGRRLPLDIKTCCDGPDTLDLLLGDDPPEVALIDWDLPGIEAPEMCRLVRDFHDHHDTWLIVMTSPEHQETASEVWRAGADDCVYTPAPAKLLSDRVTKGLCEMVSIRAARESRTAAATSAGTSAHAFGAAGASSASASPGRSLDARPSLDAVCGPDDEVRADEAVALTADLKATVDAEDLTKPAELAAGPVQLTAERVERDDVGDARRGPVQLDAVLARL